MKRKVLVGLTMIIIVALSGCLDKDNASSPDTLDIKGSDTLVQLVSNMAEAYMLDHPSAEISVTGGGSGTGIASLINNEVDIADSSRAIRGHEIESTASKGVEVWEFVIARDGLTIIVNPSNPLDRLTLDEVGAIYRGEITNWEEVGGEDREITLYGRQSTSGTYEFVRDSLLKADYSPKMLNMEGNKAIVDGVKNDLSGIGYIGIGYLTDEIKTLNLAEDEESRYVSPLDEGVIEDGTYPLTRPLYQYTNGMPGVDTLTYGFLRFELSEEGEDIIKNAGYYPPNQADKTNNNEKFEMIGG